MMVTELRQRVRDRSVFIFGLVVPIAMMFVFDLTFGSVSDIDLDPIEVAWSAPEGDSLAAVLVDVAQHGAGLDLTVRSVSADELRRATGDGEVPLGVVMPAGFTTAVTSGQAAVVEVIEGDDSGIETDIVIAVIESVLNDFGDCAVTTVAGLGLGLSPEEATRVAERAAADSGIDVVEGVTASEQLGSSDALVAGQAGMFLLFTVGFGVLGLVTEREQGTLARLRSMPMPGWLIVASKGLTGFVLGVVATAVLLVAGSILFGVDFGRPAVVAVLILCAVAAGTSLTFVVARLARTAEQSNMMQSILAIVLGIAGGAFFPTPARGVLADVLDLNPIAAVELRRFMRDRSNIFFALILPLLLVLLIGTQVNEGGGQGRVAVAAASSDLRQSLVEALERRSLRVEITDEDNVSELVARGRADVGVFIPAAAATAFSAGDAVSLEMIGGSATGAPSIARRVETAVDAVAVEQAQLVALTDAGAAEAAARSALDAARRSVAAPRIEVVDVNAVSIEFEGVAGLDLGATGQTLLFVFLSSLSGSVTLLQARRSGVLSRTLAAPVTPTRAIVGQALGRFAIAPFQGGYIMVAARLLFGVNWGNTVASLLVLVAFCAVAAGSAMLIGSVLDNEGTASGGGIGAGLVLAALGGCMVPLEFFPDKLHAIAHITPHAWAYEAFADIQRRSGGVGDVLTELAVLVAMALVVLLAGSVALRRSLARSL